MKRGPKPGFTMSEDHKNKIKISAMCSHYGRKSATVEEIIAKKEAKIKKLQEEIDAIKRRTATI